jgi:hypothetical protein
MGERSSRHLCVCVCVRSDSTGVTAALVLIGSLIFSRHRKSNNLQVQLKRVMWINRITWTQDVEEQRLDW